MSFLILIMLIFFSILPGYSSKDDEIQTDVSTDEITTRVYRSSDNLKITNKKKSFIDSMFSMDVINKNELLSMSTVIEFDEKPINVIDKVQDQKSNYFPWIMFGVMIVVLSIIVSVFRRFKI